MVTYSFSFGICSILLLLFSAIVSAPHSRYNQSCHQLLTQLITTDFFIRDFSNQNTCGNLSKISVNHTDDIPYMAVHFVSPSNSSKIAKYIKI